MAKSRGMGCALRGGGPAKVISATSKKTGPVMMSHGGYLKKKGNRTKKGGKC